MRSWQAFGLARGQKLLLSGSALGAAALGFLPLFGGPGYESSLALGLLLPLPVACVCAAFVSPPEHGKLSAALRSPSRALSAALRFAVLLLLAHLVIVLLHGARVGFCDPVQGLLLFALGPACGVFLAAAWGSVCGLLGGHLGGNRGRALGIWLAAAGPLLGVLGSLWRFLSSPMVFAFDPFAGFFAGTLYDTVIDAVPRLITYRVGSAGSLLAVVCGCALLRRSTRGRLDMSAPRQHPGWLGLLVCGLGASLAVYLAGPALGHYQTTESIRRALGQSWQSARCDIVYASGILPERIRLLGKECDAHIASHEAYFETRMPERITVFVFQSPRQKGALMGASNTYIAKPWRREVYVQTENYPHPVLSHELAHVVAGTFARGPLKVAGPLWGWIPDPGRIEGFAVAAAPREDSDYTPLEWTRAMRDLGVLPPLRSLFRLSFLTENSSTGYTVAGAVVDWLRGKYGPRALRAWYAGESIEAAFEGQHLAGLSRDFDAELDRVVLPEQALELARARFDRPAIFGRRCPHVVDSLLDDASAAFERFDIEAASEDYTRSLQLDRSNLTARLGLAACDQRRGADQEALARYEALADDASLTRVERALVLERLADRALLDGDMSRARQLYDETERYAFDEQRSRAIAVKRFAIDSERGRSAIVDLLIGDPRLGSDLVEASAALGEWAEREPELGLADYLIGKNLYSRARWGDARTYLQQALQQNLPLASVRREALRTSIFANCALDDLPSAGAALQKYLLEPELSSARRLGMQRFAATCGLPETR
jgi:tetratricopeptide (TPR) repeat protein